MDCRLSRELLAADFADDETSPFRGREITEHLASCSPCRAFSKELNECATEPLRAYAEVSPPEELWIAIKDELHTTGLIKDGYDPELQPVAPESVVVRSTDGEGFIRKLLRSFSIPRPAIAATAIAIILVGVYVYNPAGEDNSPDIYASLDGDEANLLSLYTYGDETSNAQHLNLGTSIEEYFL